MLMYRTMPGSEAARPIGGRHSQMRCQQATCAAITPAASAYVGFPCCFVMYTSFVLSRCLLWGQTQRTPSGTLAACSLCATYRLCYFQGLLHFQLLTQTKALAAAVFHFRWRM